MLPPGEVAKVVQVGILTHPSQVDESGERLFRDAIDVQAFFRYETRKFLQLLGRTRCIGTVKGLRATAFTGHDLRWFTTDWAMARDI